MRLAALISLGLAVLPAMAGAQQLSVEEGEKALAEAAERARANYQGLSFEDFKAKTPYLSELGKWVVNGDVAIRNEKLLREWWAQNVQSAPPAATGETPEFTIALVGGLDQIWNVAQKHNLTYCISNSFGPRKAAVVEAMASATGAWQAVADITYVYLSTEDSDCNTSNDRVLFDVVPMSQTGSLLAVAFFPNEPRTARTLRINTPAFNLSSSGKLTLVGILRHELGHTLGARHEHTRPDAGACFEDPDWRGVTDYDAFSVMHYPQCNGQGDWTLNLTAKDKSGVACIYGAAAGFSIDTSVCKPAGLLAFGPTAMEEGDTQSFGPLAVTPGTRSIARLSAGEGDAGDPDLYLKFDAPALRSDFDCRPFNEGPDEICDVVVPVGASAASVMVAGFTKANFRLEVMGAN